MTHTPYVRVKMLKPHTVELDGGGRQSYSPGEFYFMEVAPAVELFLTDVLALDCIPDQPGRVRKAEVEALFVKPEPPPVEEPVVEPVTVVEPVLDPTPIKEG